MWDSCSDIGVCILFFLSGQIKLAIMSTTILMIYRTITAYWVYQMTTFAEAVLQFLDLLVIKYVHRSHLLGEVMGAQSRIKSWESTMETYPQIIIQLYYLMSVTGNLYDGGALHGGLIYISIAASMLSLQSPFTCVDERYVKAQTELCWTVLVSALIISQRLVELSLRLIVMALFSCTMGGWAAVYLMLTQFLLLTGFQYISELSDAQNRLNCLSLFKKVLSNRMVWLSWVGAPNCLATAFQCVRILENATIIMIAYFVGTDVPRYTQTFWVVVWCASVYVVLFLIANFVLDIRREEPAGLKMAIQHNDATMFSWLMKSDVNPNDMVETHGKSIPAFVYAARFGLGGDARKIIFSFCNSFADPSPVFRDATCVDRFIMPAIISEDADLTIWVYSVRGCPINITDWAIETDGSTDARYNTTWNLDGSYNDRPRWVDLGLEMHIVYSTRMIKVTEFAIGEGAGKGRSYLYSGGWQMSSSETGEEKPMFVHRSQSILPPTTGWDKGPNTFTTSAPELQFKREGTSVRSSFASRHASVHGGRTSARFSSKANLAPQRRTNPKILINKPAFNIQVDHVN